MQATQAQVQHIKQQVKAYCNLQRKYAQDKQDNDGLELQDAAYNEFVMQQFLQHKNLRRFVQDVIAQDTLPREDVLYKITCAGGKELGLTFELFNTL